MVRADRLDRLSMGDGCQQGGEGGRGGEGQGRQVQVGQS